jgi:hypothetical protein
MERFEIFSLRELMERFVENYVLQMRKKNRGRFSVPFSEEDDSVRQPVTREKRFTITIRKSETSVG